MLRFKTFSYILVIVLLVSISISVTAASEQTNIYINGEDKTDDLKPHESDNALVVNASALADEFGAELVWQSAINTLHIKKQDKIMKMMEGNPIYQANNSTLKSNGALTIIDGNCYVPPKAIAENFGFLYKHEGNNVYITKPESFVHAINWKNDGQSLVIKTDKITPYRIEESDDSKKLVLELDKAALADNFKDELSNDKFYLKINKVENRARLRLTIRSNYPIPFKREKGLEEDGNNLVINFLPQINSIDWEDRKLKINANGSVDEPEVLLLEDPRRMVVDIPGLMLNEYDLNMADNDWVKEVRVSQFKYDPLILRVVMELKEDRYLHLEDKKDPEEIVLAASDITKVENLNFNNNSISFTSDNSIKPGIFKLKDPDRLVVNLINVVRGNNFPEKIEANTSLVKKIRTARFNDETIRLVADLNGFTGYTLKEVPLSDGGYKNIITFETSYDGILLSDHDKKTDININFSEKVDYEIKKDSSHDRLIVDVQDITIDKNAKKPELAGVVEDIRISQLNQDTARFVFELNKYYKHNVFSDKQDDIINLSITKNKPATRQDSPADIIVLDAGHGGFDPGAAGPSGLKEKDVNLAIVKYMKDVLVNKGYEVVLTRKDDTFISLKDRVTTANKLNAQLFVSVHINASNSKYSEGTETYIAPGKVSNSLLLGNLLQKQLLEKLKRPDRGVKRDSFYVIKHTKMPSALVEVAFISNSHEESLLESDLFRKKAASSIAEGIIEYINIIEQGDESSNE
ncbi:MAG: N-acetylmuramoyl-L-alanine amidase [Halothermotrichaceae bacterium]